MRLAFEPPAEVRLAAPTAHTQKGSGIAGADGRRIFSSTDEVYLGDRYAPSRSGPAVGTIPESGCFVEVGCEPRARRSLRCRDLGGAALSLRNLRVESRRETGHHLPRQLRPRSTLSSRLARYASGCRLASGTHRMPPPDAPRPLQSARWFHQS